MKFSKCNDSVTKSEFQDQNFSLYFQAHVKRELCWIVSSTFKYIDYVAFDRTVDKEQSLFEFFVSPDCLQEFLDIMHYFETHHIISDMRQLPNRFINQQN